MQITGCSCFFPFSFVLTLALGCRGWRFLTHASAFQNAEHHRVHLPAPPFPLLLHGLVSPRRHRIRLDPRCRWGPGWRYWRWLCYSARSRCSSLLRHRPVLLGSLPFGRRRARRWRPFPPLLLPPLPLLGRCDRSSCAAASSASLVEQDLAALAHPHLDQLVLRFTPLHIPEVEFV